MDTRDAFSSMEKEGMKNGVFPMDRPEGVEACRKYRAEIEKKTGKKTYLKYFSGGLYMVKVADSKKVYDPVLCMMVDADSVSTRDAGPKQVFGGYEYRGVEIKRVRRHNMTYYKVDEKLFGMLKQATQYVDIKLGPAKDSKSVIDSNSSIDRAIKTMDSVNDGDLKKVYDKAMSAMKSAFRAAESGSNIEKAIDDMSEAMQTGIEELVDVSNEYARRFTFYKNELMTAKRSYNQILSKMYRDKKKG